MSWRWVVDEGVEPAPDALEELHAARLLVPAAVVVASRIVLPTGELDRGSAPWARILDKEQAIEAARLGLLAVRAVRPGAMLVRDGIEPTLAGTAAALRAGTGIVAPRSVAVRRFPRRAETLPQRLALLRAGHWTREERLWQVLLALRGG